MALHESGLCAAESANCLIELSETCTTSEASKEYTHGNNVELTLPERVKVRCSPQLCQIRWLRSKGAILVLLWNCLIANNFGPLSTIVSEILHLYTSDEKTIIVVQEVIEGLSFVLLYPLAGWLADVYFGRYKVICTSLQLMWVGVVAITACVCIEVGTGVDLLPFQYSILPVALLAVQCGIAGFKANAIPFGTDQLVDGSSKELSAYIHWYVFAIAVNVRVLSIPFSCFLDSSDNMFLLQLLVQAACLSLALCFNFLFRNWLVIGPVTVNPFKKIYQVLNYARKNKHPRFRSAFTYHVEDKPSRIELCKPLYGGPFTVEEVEEVKTFLQMLCVVAPMSVAYLMVIFASGTLSMLSVHIPSDYNCFVKDFVDRNYLWMVLILVPFYQFVLYPFVHGLIPSMLVRAGIGTVLTIASFVAQLAIDIIGRLDSSHSKLHHTNRTEFGDTCIFTEGSAELGIDYNWVVLPGILLGTGGLFHLIALYEFVFAQAPHSMKGLFIGLIYGAQGIFNLGYLILKVPFVYGVADSQMSFPTCGFFYFLLNIIVLAVIFAWYIFAARKYKKRERDVPERHQSFAEEYYDKYLSMSHGTI